MANYVVATSSDWFNVGDIPNSLSEHSWEFIKTREDLTFERLTSLNPDRIFFPHWNFLISSQLLNRWDCVVFHTGPLPLGRGGTPIQNLIEAGISHAPLNALRATEYIDAGPIFASREIDLSGSLGDIFERIREGVASLIEQIVLHNPVPQEQVGEPTYFERRTPEMSEINGSESVEEIYDKIRMLDYDGYPRAFLRVGRLRLIFSNSEKSKGSVTASVVIREEFN